MKEGDEKIISNIEPKDAYGKAVGKDVEFSTDFLTGVEEQYAVTNITDIDATVTWIPEIGKKFTFMPSAWGIDPNSNPYWYFENATEVISFNDTHAVVKTTPEDDLTNITFYPFWENKTDIFVDDTTISIVTTPEIGSNFTYLSYLIVVESVTEDIINISITLGNDTTYQEWNRTLDLNRTVTISRVFTDLSKDLLESILGDFGYSFHELAGKTLNFRVKVLRIYKVN
jgi:hypothetical protein